MAKLMKDHPVSSLANVNDLNPSHWEAEAFAIVKDFAYVGGIKEGQLPPTETDPYVVKGVQITEKQLVTAGYRLANLLKSMKISTSPKEPTSELLLLVN